jgi:transglutaminase-like putative cysteine protease
MDFQKLAAAACGAMIYVISIAQTDVASARPADAGASSNLDAIISINGQEAGLYQEHTVYGADEVQDTVDQQIVINRLGSSVEILSKEVSFQDNKGHLIKGHFEATSSKSTVTTDLVVQPHAIALQIHSGGRSYSRSLPLTGELVGPEGVRLMLVNAGSSEETLHYQTFTSALNDLMDVSLRPISRETVTIDGIGIQTRKLEMRASGIPTPWLLWVDSAGRTVRMLQDSPFGPIETERRDGIRLARTAGATLSEDRYENTLAVSNIRLPHPRELKSVTVELTKKQKDGIDWPNLASETQTILSKTSDRVVLQIFQTKLPLPSTAFAPAAAEYSRPNALLQSDDPEVQRTARTIADGEPDPWKVALALQKWTFENMHFDTGIAIAPASEVVRDRHGTCMGYSILLASLARAANIPARLKVGYVYDGGIWGGHAWVEVFIRGSWVGIDAAEYHPGIADAARIAVITATGESGSIEGVGDLGSLYSKIDIRTMNYRQMGDMVAVGPEQKDYIVRGDQYNNPWLKVRVHKPANAQFTELDAHWPNPALVTVQDHGSTASLLYGRAVPTSPSALEATLAQSLKSDNRPTSVRWAAMPALRVRTADKEAILAVAGDAYWAILASGPASHALLNQMLDSTSIAELNRMPTRGAP